MNEPSGPAHASTPEAPADDPSAGSEYWVFDESRRILSHGAFDFDASQRSSLELPCLHVVRANVGSATVRIDEGRCSGIEALEASVAQLPSIPYATFDQGLLDAAPESVIAWLAERTAVGLMLSDRASPDAVARLLALPNLEVIWGGTVDLTHVVAMARLKQLRVTGLVGQARLIEARNLRSLTMLYGSEPEALADLAVLRGLRALRELAVATRSHDLTPLEEFRALEVLEVAFAGSDAAPSADTLLPVAGLSELRTLGFYGSGVPSTAEGFAHLSDLSKLEVLAVHGDSAAFTDEALRALVPLTRLHTLSLAGVPVRRLDGVGRLTGLRKLSLHACESLEAEALATVASLPLEELALTGMTLPNAWIAPLRDARTLHALRLDEGISASAAAQLRRALPQTDVISPYE